MLKRILCSVGLLGILVFQMTQAHPDGAPTNTQTNTSGATSTNQVSIYSEGNYRYIISNGIPYSHGAFPNANNPNTVSAQQYKFKVPIQPVIASRITPLRGQMDFGVAVDGVPFDPGTAELWNNDPNWRYEAMSGKINLGMDFNNAHVQPNGAYHYHAIPVEVTKGLNASQHSPIIGYAADGFPIYALYGYSVANDPNSSIKKLTSSYQLRQGTRPSGPGGTYDGTFTQDYTYVAGTGDLDECNGRETITQDYPNGTYAYFITETFPLIPRCFRGTPDPSFTKQGGGGANNMQRPGPGGPQGSQRRPPPPMR